MQKPVLSILLVLAILLVGGYAAFANGEPATEVRLATWRSLDNLDPAYTTRTEEVQLFDGLFQGLIDMDNGEPTGGDASSWTISGDGRIYTFKLRDDIFWSDGKPVTAHDYLLAFRRMLDPSLDVAPRPTYMLRSIKNAEAVEAKKKKVRELGIRAIDDRTLEIELSSPASYFLDILAYPGIVPVPNHVVQQLGNDWCEQLPLVSNGAYVLIKKRHGEHLVLQKRNSVDHPEAPDFVHMIHTKNSDDAMRRVINSELDIIYDIRKSEIEWVKNRIGFELTTVSLPNTVYAVFNTKNRKLADRRVRRALFLAIDRKAIAKATDSQPTVSFASIGMLKGAEEGLRDDLLGKERKSRVARARALLAEAGYSPDKPLEITIMKVPRLVLGNTALALRSMFAQIGVQVKIEEVPENEHSPRLVAKDYEVSTANWIADYDDAMAFYGILESDASKNHSAFRNETYDQLIKEALRERDTVKRRKIYVKLENILREEAPVVPIAQTGYTFVSAPGIASIGVQKVDGKDGETIQKFLISLYNIRFDKGGG